MIGQITPLVQEASRRRWAMATSAHFMGSVLSGATVGLVLGLLGALAKLDQSRLMLACFCLLLALCILRQVRLVYVPLPSFQRQTPKWFTSQYGDVWGAFAWGGDLGQGWTTRIEVAGIYALLAWCTLDGSVVLGSVTMGVFGAARAAPVVAAGLMAAYRHGGVLPSALVFGSPWTPRVNVLFLGLALITTLGIE
jgi:hypothetical protein